MFRTLCIAAACFFAGQATAAPPSPLVGVWVEVNGPGMARIAPCADAPDRLCAMGLARRTGAETGLVMTGISADGANRWRGTYHDGNRKLPATLRLPQANRVDMKVCLFVICQTAHYARNP
jgi:uncharacterized protein (DUF2147 family)